jgi:hypothetical protein
MNISHQLSVNSDEPEPVRVRLVLMYGENIGVEHQSI